jgi:hypothetical protein
VRSENVNRKYVFRPGDKVMYDDAKGTVLNRIPSNRSCDDYEVLWDWNGSTSVVWGSDLTLRPFAKAMRALGSRLTFLPLLVLSIVELTWHALDHDWATAASWAVAVVVNVFGYAMLSVESRKK